MEVDAMLADSVVTAEGKIYVQGGGWNTIYVQGLPARHDRIGIAVLIRVPWTATNESHKVDVRMEDSDGGVMPLGDAPPGMESPDGKIYRLGGEFNVGRPPMLPPGDEQVVPISMNIGGLLFEKPDAYTIIVAIDGTDLKRLPLRIAQLPMTGPLPQ